jgi:hypothetical protein
VLVPTGQVPEKPSQPIEMPPDTGEPKDEES